MRPDWPREGLGRIPVSLEFVQVLQIEANNRPVTHHLFTVSRCERLLHSLHHGVVRGETKLVNDTPLMSVVGQGGL